MRSHRVDGIARIKRIDAPGAMDMSIDEAWNDKMPLESDVHPFVRAGPYLRNPSLSHNQNPGGEDPIGEDQICTGQDDLGHVLCGYVGSVPAPVGVHMQLAPGKRTGFEIDVRLEYLAVNACEEQ